MKCRRVEPNLYIQVNKSGTESWVARFDINGKTVWRGLGLVKFVTKTQAREDMQRLRISLRTGEEPTRVRTAPTFAEILPRALDDIQNSRQWKFGEMRHRWEQTLNAIAVPVIGNIPVDKIQPDDVLRCLKPTWTTKHDTTSRTRMRIEAVLNWCALMKYRSGANPASWRGNLEFALPRGSKVKPVKHLEALTIEEVKRVVAYCRKNPSVVNGAILFIIATVGRVRECTEVRRSEIDGDIWTVPAERMKAGKPHRVPLTDLAREGLAMGHPRNDAIFFGQKATFINPEVPRLKLIKILDRQVTAHGIRSTFKDWCSKNGVDEILSEKALAHVFGNKVTSAYQRDDLLERRRRVMTKWAKAIS